MRSARRITLRRILRIAPIRHITVLYVLLFLICTVISYMGNPGLTTFGDACWVSFQTITTIGFGDMDTSSTVTRISMVILSLVSLFYLAIITGVVTTYFIEMLKHQKKGSLTELANKIEHLEDLSHEELAELSETVRKYRSK